MAAAENREDWEQTYIDESPNPIEEKRTYLDAIGNEDLLTDGNVNLDDRDRNINQYFDWLAEEYAEGMGADPEDVTHQDIVNYVQHLEKGTVLGPMSSMYSSVDLLESINDLYEEVVGEDENTERAEEVFNFHSEVTGKYDPERNDEYDKDTQLDIWRLQYDIAEGGGAFALGLSDTSNFFSNYSRTEVVPEMLQNIARQDEEGEYADQIIDVLQAFVENHVENYFEENFEERIVDIEQTLEQYDEDVTDLTNRVITLEGSLTTINDLSDEIENIYEILEAHSEQFEGITDRLNELEDQMGEYDDQLAELETRLQGYVDEQITELRENIDDELEAIQNQLNGVEATARTHGDEISDLDDRVSENEDDIDEVGDRVSDNENRIEANSDAIDIHGDRLESLRSDLDDLETTVTALSGLEGRVEDLEDSMNNAENRLDVHNTTLRAHRERFDGHEDRLDDYETRLEDAEDDILDLYSELDDLRDTMEDVEERVEDHGEDFYNQKMRDGNMAMERAELIRNEMEGSDAFKIAEGKPDEIEYHSLFAKIGNKFVNLLKR